MNPVDRKGRTTAAVGCDEGRHVAPMKNNKLMYKTFYLETFSIELFRL